MEDLLSGDMELWKAYWILFAGGTLFLSLIEQWLAKNIESPWFLIFISILIILYIVVVSIGVWNSANNYVGDTMWAIAAKIVVTIAILRGVFLFLGLIYVLLGKYILMLLLFIFLEGGLYIFKPEWSFFG